MKPKGEREIRRVYGDIRVRDGHTSPRSWIKDNIVMFLSPPFRECAPFKVWCHRLVAAELEQILLDIQAQEAVLDKPLIFTYDGCWVPRVKRGMSKMSTHSWGIAIDINARRNPLGGKSNQSQRMVEMFTRRGWRWGGTWNRRDAMHFQAASGY